MLSKYKQVANYILYTYIFQNLSYYGYINKNNVQLYNIDLGNDNMLNITFDCDKKLFNEFNISYWDNIVDKLNLHFDSDGYKKPEYHLSSNTSLLLLKFDINQIDHINSLLIKKKIEHLIEHA